MNASDCGVAKLRWKTGTSEMWHEIYLHNSMVLLFTRTDVDAIVLHKTTSLQMEDMMNKIIEKRQVRFLHD